MVHLVVHDGREPLNFVLTELLGMKALIVEQNQPVQVAEVLLLSLKVSDAGWEITNIDL